MVLTTFGGAQAVYAFAAGASGFRRQELEVRDRTQAVVWAYRTGFATPSL